MLEYVMPSWLVATSTMIVCPTMPWKSLKTRLVSVVTLSTTAVNRKKGKPLIVSPPQNKKSDHKLNPLQSGELE